MLSKRNREYMAWEGAAKMQALVGCDASARPSCGFFPDSRALHRFWENDDGSTNEAVSWNPNHDEESDDESIDSQMEPEPEPEDQEV